MQQEIDAREFAEWMAYYSIDPFGQWRDNYHAAMVSAILVNANRSKGRPSTPGDFIIKTERLKPQTSKQMKANLKAWTAVRNANARK